jgi:hypothetical protein
VVIKFPLPAGSFIILSTMPLFSFSSDFVHPANGCAEANDAQHNKNTIVIAEFFFMPVEMV